MAARFALNLVLYLMMLAQNLLSVSSACKDAGEAAAAGNASHQSFLLIHGSSGSASYWFQTLGALKEKGFGAVALDMASNGIDSTPVCDVKSLADWAAPAVTYLQGLDPCKQVILVVHSLGGLVGLYLTDKFPDKFEAVIYLTATAPRNGESLMAYTGETRFPSTIEGPCFLYDPNNTRRDETARKIACQTCKEEMIQLFEHTARPQSKFVVRSVVNTTERNGVERFFIRTSLDRVLPPPLQDKFIANLRPVKVYRLVSDHMAMLSANRALVRILVKIANKIRKSGKQT